MHFVGKLMVAVQQDDKTLRPPLRHPDGPGDRGPSGMTEYSTFYVNFNFVAIFCFSALSRRPKDFRGKPSNPDEVRDPRAKKRRKDIYSLDIQVNY